MAGYIIVDVKTRKILIPCIIIALLLFVIGIIIGYFSAPRGSKGTSSPCSLKSAVQASCQINQFTEEGKRYFDRYVEKDLTVCVKDSDSCNSYKLPRTYNVYHLNGKQINIDGKLDDEAWKEVPWSENFVDMRSELYPEPFLDTKIKLRWDDSRLYVGAYLSEPNLWATYTQPDSKIYLENALDMLMDVDGSMFYYKQMQINVLGTMMDQVLVKSPHDAGAKLKEWHAGTSSAVYAEGTVNNPGDVDQFWTAEMSFTFEALAANSSRTTNKPGSNEAWFVNFGRSEQHLNVTNNTYVQIEDLATRWWSWQPCNAINLQLQDRWGLMQFKTDLTDLQFDFPRWHIYRALFDMMDAMKKYKALNAKYTDQIEELDVPPYLLSRTCVEVPDITLTKTDGVNDFLVTIKSKLITHKPARIRSDRLVTFE